MDVATLKDQARGLEQRGKNADALAIYRKILAHLEGTSGILRELPLYVKAGDLNLKLGDERTAISMYERAAKRYAAYGSSKSVIALCKKILRVDSARSYEYLGLARLMIERGHLAEASRVLADYADRMRLGKAKSVLEQLADRPEAEITVVLDLMVELASRVERERIKSTEVRSDADSREGDPVPEKQPDRQPDAAGEAFEAPGDRIVESQFGTERKARLAVDHASASLDDSGSRPGLDQEASAPHSGSGPLAIDHSSASLDDSGSRPAIEPKGDETGGGDEEIRVDHQSALLDDSGSRPAVEHAPPRAEATPEIPVEEGPVSTPGDIPPETLPWRIDRQAEHERADEARPPEAMTRAEVPPRREPMRSSQPRPALTFTTHRRRKGRGVRIVLATMVLIVGGGAALWFSGMLPFGFLEGSASGGRPPAQRTGNDSSATDTQDSAVGGAVPVRQLENLDSIARASLDSVAPPAVSATLDSLVDTTGMVAAQPVGVNPAGNVPPEAGIGQIDAAREADSVVAVDGLEIQLITQIETGGYVVGQRLESGERLTLTVIPLGSDSADPSATGQVRVEVVGDTAVGRVLFGGYTVRGSGLVTPEEMERLLRRLVERQPSGR